MEGMKEVMAQKKQEAQEAEVERELFKWAVPERADEAKT